MSARITDPDVDAFMARTADWRAEFERLRAIALDCDLEEDFKWGWPCYRLGRSNIVLMHGFKDYCALLFFKGALMKDPGGILIQQTENVQAARQIRFTSAEQIAGMENVLKSYIHDAIDIERSGAKVAMKKTGEFAMPDEFRDAIEKDAALKTAFQALTPGRQRAYLLHFASAKQSATRIARIDKARPSILEGKGLND
jgi:uncharacterized protein YdeI (YjbR/CyaY-like superfamily)